MFSIREHFGKKIHLIFFGVSFLKDAWPFFNMGILNRLHGKKKAARSFNRAAGKEVFNLPD